MIEKAYTFQAMISSTKETDGETIPKVSSVQNSDAQTMFKELDIKNHQTHPVEGVLKTATAANDQIILRNVVVVTAIEATVSKRPLVSVIRK